MERFSPYLRLMRLHQPVGSWLVFWPCCLALYYAPLTGAVLPPGHSYATLIGIFFLGSIISRSAECVMNDMADRDFDKHVVRTKTRPLASGELSMRQAARLLVLLGFLGLLLLSRLPSATWLLLGPALFLLVTYPFMKRFTWWPQAFLGLAINFGAFFAWVSVTNGIHMPLLLIYTACFFWTLGYDTIYGHMDKEDDAKIGVKSTSRYFGKHSKRWIGGFYSIAFLLLLLAAYVPFHNAPAPTTAFSTFCLPLLVPIGLHFVWQLKTVQLDSPENCLRVFKSNAWLGGITTASVLAFQVVF